MNRLYLHLFFVILNIIIIINPIDAQTAIKYTDTTYWYSIGDESHAVDVFYVYPAVSTISFVDNDSSWFADISLPEVRKEANGNQRFNKMLYGEYNFYAPYYRQLIYEAYSQPDSIVRQLAQTAAKDVIDAFQFYMTHYNHGRPFFLMGHSQGSQMLIELLKHGMTEEQRELMVAAYCIGYQVTADELSKYPVALQPATDSTETGKIIVFNSVTDPTAIGMVSRNDVVGVNPTTWTMENYTIPAKFHLGMAKYNDTRDSVLIVPCPTKTYLYKHNTVCPDLDPEMVFIPAYEQMFPKGNLHFADSWLFGGNVVENMRCRLRHFRLPKTNGNLCDEQEELPTISADRPGYTWGTEVMHHHKFSWENGFGFESDNGVPSITLNSTIVRYGIFENVELRVGTDFLMFDDGQSPNLTFGMNPLTIGTKIKVYDGTDVLPSVGLLAEFHSPRLGSKDLLPSHLAPSMYLLFENDINDWFYVCYNVGAEWDGDSSAPTTFLSLCLGFSLTESLGTFIESANYFCLGNDNLYLTEFGITWLASRRVQLDLSADLDLKNMGKFFAVGGGVAWLIN